MQNIADPGEKLARRKVIDLNGLGHAGQPIPTAVRVGPLLVSGTISGKDRSTGEVPPDLASQVKKAFENVEAVMVAAGGSMGDIAKVTIHLRDRAGREALNSIWTTWFPEPEDRPARHVVVGDLPGSLHIQVEIIAYIETVGDE